MPDLRRQSYDLTNLTGGPGANPERPVNDRPAVLVSYSAKEAITVAIAARIAGRPARTIRDWAERFHLGRRIGAHWSVSRVALQMHLDGDHTALRLYLAGDRSSPRVASYFDGLGLTALIKDRRTEGAAAP